MCQKHVKNFRVFFPGTEFNQLDLLPPVQIELPIQIHPESLILIGGSELSQQ